MERRAFAELMLPLPVGGTFTYRIPEDLSGQVREGVRVVVQFGSRKIYTALVIRLQEYPPPGLDPKPILSVLDERPIVTPAQVKFWEWLSEYYLCHPGEVMNAALPSAFKLASESKIALNPLQPAEMPQLNEKEHLLVDALGHRKSLALSEVSKILEQQKTIPIVKGLIEKGIVVPEEELNDPYRPRMETYATMAPELAENEDALRELFDQLERRAPKQLAILMTWMRLSGFGFGPVKEIRRTDLLKESKGTAAQLDALVEKGVFLVTQRVAGRFDDPGDISDTASIILSDGQQQALESVRESFEKHDVVLLHGVTSSGKTELYIKLIRETIDQGKQVLFLLPEIALTTQIVNRLRKYFGGRVGVYHSKFHMHDRVEVWNGVLNDGGVEAVSGGRVSIVLGARSALFLPFSNLGLVVVDEEHDSSYKQNDPAPRYNGRDAAVYLARLHGAKALLGSATPSIESYNNARQEKYGLVSLTERYGNMELPLIRVVDVRDALRSGKMKGHFSTELLERTGEALAAGEQVILFQNRRGFSLRLECEMCHWMPSCKNCDVTLVYHKKSNQLRCHYCGFVSGIPTECPDCRSHRILMKGFGTEKVEEELGLMLPGTRIARLDLDTARSRHALHQIISDFEERKTDILVGTQMVTKGLDFGNVSLVCILNADNMLSYPDFRSAERSFQLMAQVSGRSGRRKRQGLVIIQTYNPSHAVIRDVVNHDYVSLFHRQLTERVKFGYPPATRLILIKLKHKDSNKLNKSADDLARRMRKVFGKRVLGPEYPMVGRIMTYYIKHILLKIEREAPAAALKKTLTETITAFSAMEANKSVRVVIDVDPQ